MPKDYSGQNLRGRSFRGQNLEGANFSGADIRGADFSHANLKGANLSYAQAGLQKRWAAFLVLVSWLISGLAGFLSASFGALIRYIFEDSSLENRVSSWVALIVLIIVFIVIIRQGLNSNVVVAGAGAITIAGAIAGGFTGGGFAGGFTGGFAGAIAGGFAIAIAGATAGATTGGFAIAIAIAIAGATAGGFAIAGAGAVILLSIYISRRSLKGDPRYALIRDIAIAFAAFKGTSFRSADLTDANFTEATLKSTDFRKAILTRTCFHKTKKLDRVRPGSTYLQKAEVRKLLVTGVGQDKKFDYQDLRGINLEGANLTNTSFLGANLKRATFQGANLIDTDFMIANLNEVNLQDANLSRANLVQTQLFQADFTGATLTGAYIQDWGITSDTKFDGVRCEYVHMRHPTKENPDPLRKPDNKKEVFADGEFADFIKPIVDTLDLYHNSNVDPRAIAISFKQLAENHPDAELEIVAMEKRGQDKFLLRAKTAPTADKSELSAEYFTIYNELKALAQKEVKALIAEKDNRIASLENMVVTALQSPSFYAETYNNQGDTMPRKESNFNLQGAQFAGGLVDADTVNAHQIGGNIYNSEQRQNPEQTKTILILAANPKTTTSLRLDEEVREIDAGLQRAKKRDRFDLKQLWAVRIQDVYQSLLDFKPQIVHFSGHGTGDDGLVLEDETGNVRLVDTVALAGLFELFANDIECVVLNACYTFVQASAISQHIPYVIGMRKEVGDKAAIKFATGFYSALGSGESVEFAYKLGCNVIQLEGIPENLTPQLKKKV